MGVKDLWHVLSPICERKPLWELQDKIIAVDLSCWVCDSQNVAEYSNQPNMYLRNIFFRTSSLLLLGAIPVFVLDGVAPEMKAAVMEQRKAARRFTQPQKDGMQTTRKGNRRQLKSIHKRCCELFKCLGLKFIESSGEAEAMCAALDKHGLVDGCISQDSDCFLYGAQTVYRNFSVTTGSATGGPGFSVDCYTMASVEKCLGLTRNKLIAFSLLCGCDYFQQGVEGVGKESALKFLASVQDDAVLNRLRQWRVDEYYERLELERSMGGCEQCGHIGKKGAHLKKGCQQCHTDIGCAKKTNPVCLAQMESEQKKTLITELGIRKKALLVPDFPSERIIEEFSSSNITVPSKLDTEWGQPDIMAFLRLAVRALKWDEVYAFNKFFPILTRWTLLKTSQRSKDSCPVYPIEIRKSRVLRGIACYEIKWADKTNLFDTISSQIDTAQMFCTIEPKGLVEKAYPDLVNKFTTEVQEAKRAKRKGKLKTSKERGKATDPNKARCETCGGCDGCLCRFTQQKSRSKGISEKRKSQKPLPKDRMSNNQLSLSPFLQKPLKEKPSKSFDVSMEDAFEKSLILDDQNYDEGDLSAVVMGIVGEEAYFKYSSVPSQTPNVDQSAPKAAEKPSQDSSDDSSDLKINIPLIERIRMKKKSIGPLAFSSPLRKQSKRNIQYTNQSQPYSPLAGNISPDAPAAPVAAVAALARRQSISTSEAAKRFSVSFRAFSRKDLSESPIWRTMSDERLSSMSRCSSDSDELELEEQFQRFLCSSDNQ